METETEARHAERPAERRSEVIVFAAALAVITIGRIALLRGLADQGYFAKYVYFADEILVGRIPADRLGDLSSGYLWFVTLLRALSISPLAIRDVQLVLVSLAAWAVAATARRFGGRLAAIGAAAALLMSSAVFLNASELEPETLILAANAAALFCVFRNAPPRWALVAGGLTVGLSIIARPVAMLTLVPLVLWLMTRPMRRFSEVPEAEAGPTNDGGPAGRGAFANVLVFLMGAVVPIVVASIINVALTGGILFMDPGTVFYEGMNPHAAGYAGVQPRIINDLETSIREPDALHVTYRQVASAASGRELSRADANRYWTTRAMEFARSYPSTAGALVLRKGGLAVNNYDAWDLVTLERKSRLLRSFFWLPFGALLAFAVAGVVMGGDRVRWFLALHAIAAAAVLVLFYVTARQRNAVLPSLAILAGLAVAEVYAAFRTGRMRTVAVATTVVVVTLAVSLPQGVAQREDRYAWEAARKSSAFIVQSKAALERGDRTAAISAAASAATYLTGLEPQVPPQPLRDAVQHQAKATAPQRLFDLAIVSARAGDLETADQVLAALQADGYRPRRENRATSSVAYYRARIALRKGASAEASRLLGVALQETPGDANVLALHGVVSGDGTALELLRRLHDPFSAELARARALYDSGRSGEALDALEALRKRIAVWDRPRMLTAAMQRGQMLP